MKTSSDNLLGLVRFSESFEPSPYLCPAGRWSIGYGSTYYEDDRPVGPNDPDITEARAESLMRSTLRRYEAAVNRLVSVPLSQGQFDALVDFAYNAGIENLRTSTLLRLLNAGDYVGAAAQFERWDKARVNGVMVSLPGLRVRCRRRRNLFEGRSWDAT